MRSVRAAFAARHFLEHFSARLRRQLDIEFAIDARNLAFPIGTQLIEMDMRDCAIEICKRCLDARMAQLQGCGPKRCSG